MRRKWITGCCLALALVALHPGSGFAQDLRLTIDAGKVTLVARNVSVRQIMAEWEKVGQTSIPNRERIPDAIVTLTLTDVAESSALSTVLRSGYGYLAVARPETAAHTSAYRTILLMAAAPRSAATSSQSPQSPRGDSPQSSERRLFQPPQGASAGSMLVPGGPLRAGSPFALTDNDGEDQQDDGMPGDPARQNPGLFQMRVVGPNGQVITVPSPDGRPARGDLGDPGANAPVTPGLMVPTSPAGAARPGEVIPVPSKRPGTPLFPSKPPG
jgi:hypothetical protein